jgi:hypothetical protein
VDGGRCRTRPPARSGRGPRRRTAPASAPRRYRSRAARSRRRLHRWTHGTGAEVYSGATRTSVLYWHASEYRDEPAGPR